MMTTEEQFEPDLEGQEGTPWYADPKYNRYWSHHAQMKAWLRAHETAHSCAQNAAANSSLQSYHQYYLHHQWCQYYNHYYRTRPYPQPHPHWHNHSSQQGNDNHHKSHREAYSQPHQYSSYRGNGKQYVTDQSDVDYLDNGVSESQMEDEEEEDFMHGGGDEEFEVELSEEMRQFFLQSQKHREELKEMKLAFAKKREQSEIKEDTTPEKIAVESTSYEDEFVAPGSRKNKKKIIGAPTEQPGKRRAEEMKVRKGDNFFFFFFWGGATLCIALP